MAGRWGDQVHYGNFGWSLPQRRGRLLAQELLDARDRLVGRLLGGEALAERERCGAIIQHGWDIGQFAVACLAHTFRA
jgi:hypothetical protein